MKFTRFAIPVAASALLLTGCGAEVESQGKGSGKSTVKRCGESVEYTVPKRAEAAVAEQAPKGKPVPVFLYDSGTDQPFTAGNQVPPNDIIKTAGGKNIFDRLEERWTQVNWEAVTQAEPEVIMIFDYGDQPAEKKIEFLKKSPHTKELPAVKKDNFFILDYNEGISSPRNIDGLEKFGKYMRAFEN
ncbi:hypothetical protein CG717_27485 [Streptomyces sp. CB02613]|uniref:ABC transporter substrate-binding protein n=1 Tax=Streptomyces sp. CB02613 TaxID=2020328 RepID=UPI000C277484|nr:ABC transporter substrate-binding protein [Streptomyces sp. CB02613]PJN27382.1 hypothetical protein CG717_27485 [Streptomyces sp. CB02613]